MNFLGNSLFLFILCFDYIVCPFDNDDFFTLLCEADENHMEKLYKICEKDLKDAVDGCLQKCYIEMRNRRCPTLRIDEKYYQFVMCDTALWSEFCQSCAIPCIQKLQVSYNAVANIQDWSACMTEAVRSMEDEIEHQDDPNYRPDPNPGPNPRPKPGPGPGPKKGKKNKGKTKNKNNDKSTGNNRKLSLKLKNN